MTPRTRGDDLATLENLRPNGGKFGNLIDHATAHPATRRILQNHVRSVYAPGEPELSQIFATTSTLTGEPIHRNTSLTCPAEDMIYHSKFKREMCHLTGSSTGGLCAGWNGLNVM